MRRAGEKRRKRRRFENVGEIQGECSVVIEINKSQFQNLVVHLTQFRTINSIPKSPDSDEHIISTYIFYFLPPSNIDESSSSHTLLTWLILRAKIFPY